MKTAIGLGQLAGMQQARRDRRVLGDYSQQAQRHFEQYEKMSETRLKVLFDAWQNGRRGSKGVKADMVRAYMAEHPSESAAQVARACGVVRSYVHLVRKQMMVSK